MATHATTKARLLIASAFVATSTLALQAAAQPLEQSPPPAEVGGEQDSGAESEEGSAAQEEEGPESRPSTPVEEIVVTASRAPKKQLQAPSTVHVLSEDDLERAGGISLFSALDDVGGVDFAAVGVNEQRISMRGFSSQFNTRLLYLLDGRLMQLPGTGAPQGNFIPGAPLDVKSIEVVVGPAAALYGPNAHTGVINVITKTPWDESGVSARLRGGTPSLVDGSARVAGTVSDAFGYKLNVQYLQAEDFRPRRDDEQFVYAETGAGTPIHELDLLKDYGIEQLKTDASLYYRWGDWMATGSYGFSQGDTIAVTNAGRNHFRGLQVESQNLQLAGPNLFLRVSRTATDAGDAYELSSLADEVARGIDLGRLTLDDYDAIVALRDNVRFIDNSQLIDTEAQYRETVKMVELVVGTQYRFYAPESQGSYLSDGPGEPAIRLHEFGGYAHADAAVVESLHVVGAARMDWHSAYGVQISPKAAVVYEPVERSAIRLAYNRAYKSPTVIENYLSFSGLAFGNVDGYTIQDAEGNVVEEISPLSPEKVDSIELGYKGMLGDYVFADAVAYYSWYKNFIGPLALVSSPPDTYAHRPDGERVGAGTATEGILMTYPNFGRAQVTGFDLGVDVFPTRYLDLSLGGSFIKLVDFTNDDPLQDDLLLNVPDYRLKGSVTVHDVGLDGTFFRLHGRYQPAYVFRSGWWDSTAFRDDGKVPSRFVFDVAAGMDIPRTDLSVQATVANLLDNRRVDVMGTPPIGRMGFVQLSYKWSGLNN